MPKSGALGFGGHVQFTCDGWDSNAVVYEEGGGGGFFVILMIVCCICCCVRARQQRAARAYAGVPMGQPLQPGGVYPSAYVPPQPAVVVQQPGCGSSFADGMMGGVMGAVLGAELAGGGRHHHHGRHHGGGHSYHGGGHATHTSGGF